MPDLLPERDRDLVRPETELRVARVHGRPDPAPVELQPLLDELGRVGDRLFLEVAAERPAAHHLEEGQGPRIQADFVDVSCPEDLLGVHDEWGRRLLALQEVGHERLHAG